jgi:phytoene dehydrogenase-like protein
MERADVVIIGAGLAGLCCARRLAESGVSCVVLESSDGIGGRVRTDQVDGFRLDRGFQVLLTAYPEAQKILDYKALDLRAFEPGALVHLGNRFCRVSDPWRRPSRALEALFSQVGTLSDKLRVAWLRAQVSQGSADDAFDGSDVSTLAFLRARGFSPNIIERFFRPFLGGILLERELRTQSSMFRFVLRMLACGDTSIPAGGMEQIPQQLASAIPSGSIRTGAKVQVLGKNQVTLRGGEQIGARAIVVATEGPEAGRLLRSSAPASRGVACLYFAADRSPLAEPILVLNGDGDGLVNNLCVPTILSPALAPPGAALISATVLERTHTSTEQFEADVRDQLARWFGAPVWKWRLLRTYRILHAQPEPSVARPVRSSSVAPNLYVCGDYCLHASIQGAMVSGRKAAEAVLVDLINQSSAAKASEGRFV